MPPRRSTRTRASAEPPSVEQPASSKRKRVDTQEAGLVSRENLKPTSRTRRAASTSAPGAKSRVSTRSRKSLEDVPESDEEEDGDKSPRPTKKSRSSLDTEGKDQNTRE
ncbi:hypothetical protein A0H81_01339 [Grifola frondosa]|uniref:Uncharacterized protein n=1 Tax=Grifola frondosa TaxID=5627 RepID=A0A1C7MQE4_GRIFR|nr:hypothetical protein A0H81_01339 [Grifola frondosa]